MTNSTLSSPIAPRKETLLFLKMFARMQEISAPSKQHSAPSANSEDTFSPGKC